MTIPINPHLESGSVFVMVLLLGIIGTAIWTIGVQSLRIRTGTRTGTYFGILNFLVAIWCYGSVLQILAQAPSITCIISKVSLVAFDLIPPFFLLLVVSFGEDFDFRLTPQIKSFLIGGLVILFSFDILGLITNEIHHLYWNDPYFTFPIVTAGVTRNILFFFRLVLVYGIFIIALLYLLLLYQKTILQKYVIFRKQAQVLLFGSSIPFGFSIIHFLRLIPLSYVYDITPIGIVFSFFLFYWGIFQDRIIDPVQAAQKIMTANKKEGYLIYSIDQEILYISPQWFDYSITQDRHYTGHPLLTVFQESAIINFNQFLREFPHIILNTLIQGLIQQYELEIPQNNMSSKWLLLTSQPIFYKENERIMGGLLSLEDISTHKNAERVLNESNTLKSVLLRILSHDLQNSLQVIQGFAELGIFSEESEEKEQVLRKILNRSQEINFMTTQVNVFFKTQNQARQIPTEPVNLIEVLNNVLVILNEEILHKHIQVIFDYPKLPDKSCLVFANITLQSAFWNIIHNAIKFSPSKGIIRINIREEGSLWYIMIQDNGPGIPESLKTEIFEPFKTFGDKKTSGTGLGLTLVKDIIEMFNGKVWIENNFSNGTSFIICLPIYLTNKNRPQRLQNNVS
ncbi:MAG: histidine kinase N-terminal 7TM domain-containing protein [Candidatus Hermodarchaeota archaeon]